MIGSSEQHSADNRDRILHSAEHKWVVYWRDVPHTQHPTRKKARQVIRGLKKQFQPQLELPLCSKS